MAFCLTESAALSPSNEEAGIAYHEYISGAVPPVAVEKRLSVWPLHARPSFLSEALIAEGGALTIIPVVVVEVHADWLV